MCMSYQTSSAQSSRRIVNGLKSAGLSGQLYLDLNENGKQDEAEPGLNKHELRLINLKDQSSSITRTDNEGAYTFSNLEAGQYKLDFQFPDGVICPIEGITSETIGLRFENSEGLTAAIELKEGDYIYNVEIGLRAAPVASIEGMLWNDTNRNGKWEVEETGIKNFTVQLLNEQDQVIREVKSDNKGLYRFKALSDGEYRLNFPWNVDYTINRQARVKGFGIDFDTKESISKVISVEKGKDNSDYSLGLYMEGAAAISGQLWKDLNANGILDQGEPALSGTRVTLLTVDNQLVDFRISGPDGQYLFEDLMPGSYYLEVTDPNGLVLTEARNLTQKASSKFISNTRQTRVMQVSANKTQENINAGFVAASALPGTIYGQVWADQNTDGRKDKGETPVNGLQVELLGEQDFSLVALTDATGSFTFNNVPAGNYLLQPTVYSKGFSMSGAQQLLIELQASEKSFANDFGIVIQEDKPCPIPELICADPFGITEYCLSESIVPETYKLSSLDGMLSGDVSKVADRCLTYTPAPGSINQTELLYITYCRAGGTDCIEHCLEFFVGECQSKPIAKDDKLKIRCGEQALVEVLENDSKALQGEFFISDHTLPSNGDISKLNNAFQYASASDFEGVDFFTYTISDGIGGSDKATVMIEVEDCDFAPVAQDDQIRVDCSSSKTFSPLANDYDRNRDPLNICSITQPENGSLSQKGNQLIYTSTEGFAGQDQFSYTICDSGGKEANAMVKVHVSACNTAPKAEDDSANISCEPVRFHVTRNDFDADGDKLSICDYELFGPGNLQVLGEVLVYEPIAGYQGNVKVSYKICDGRGGSDRATLDLAIDCEASQTSLLAQSDSYQVIVGQEKTLAVLANDVWSDGSIVEICDFEEPAHGMVVQDGNVLTYVPETGFKGKDSFQYILCNKEGLRTRGKVELEVLAQANCDNQLDFCTQVNEPIELCVEVCSLGKVQTITRYETKEASTISNRELSCFLYTPPEAFIGLDQIDITACNELGDCSSVLVKVSVGDCEMHARPLGTTTANSSPFDTMFIPTGFSPNGDNMNDYFLIEKLSELSPEACTFEVFDGSGKLVYMDTAFHETVDGWNGVDDNTSQLLDNGTYYYVLRISQGAKPVVRKGTILLKK